MEKLTHAKFLWLFPLLQKFSGLSTLAALKRSKSGFPQAQAPACLHATHGDSGLKGILNFVLL